MMIHILNFKKIRNADVYDTIKLPYAFRIDRNKSPVGNPFDINASRTRDQSCDEYDEYFYKVISSKRLFRQYITTMIKAYKKHGKLFLLCWCAPERCHGTTIKNYIKLAALD